MNLAPPSPVALCPMTERAEPAGISYASAGVDIEAGDRAVELTETAGQEGHQT